MKERLVGAAVLVAIGVWLIPWVLDGPESALDSSSSSLELPAPEEPMPMRTQTLRLGDAVADAAAAPAAGAVVPPPAAEREPATVAAAPAPAEAAARDTHTPPAAAPAARPTPTTTPPPRAASAPAAAGDWIVQLGSFGEEGNARRIAQRSETFGYKAEVSSYRNGARTLYRVRVGPATTRALADAKASALRAHGIEAQVVAAR